MLEAQRVLLTDADVLANYRDGTVLKVPRVSLTDTVSKKLFSDGTVLKALRVLLTDADIFASHTLTTGMCLKRHAFLLTHTDSS